MTPGGSGLYNQAPNMEDLEARMAEDVILRETRASDFPVLFEQQSDPEARTMAAFTEERPPDRETFIARQLANISNPSNIMRTILVDGQVAGDVFSYLDDGHREVGYWLGKAFWGRGVATRALEQFLAVVTTRPLYARAAKDNPGSLRVLEKCGFTLVGSDWAYANARGMEIEEALLRLDAPDGSATN